MGEIVGTPDGAGKHVGIVVARWNELVTKELLEGCLDELRRCGGPEVTVVRVPGSWEIPLAATALVERGEVDGVVALGCILQGETAHAGQLAGDVAGALMALQNASGVPVAWGVLTPETAAQALDRAGLKHGNKGREAAAALLETASALEQLRGG
ncbi:MAG: 6,7-dimethyl-8-ribityllumazine synthase [Fimbriimonadaceae bacterium]|nr:6,7-dimethyl-8-ribityllumazine synthase [Fimbriimonadaceae bacterium]